MVVMTTTATTMKAVVVVIMRMATTQSTNEADDHGSKGFATNSRLCAMGRQSRTLPPGAGLCSVVFFLVQVGRFVGFTATEYGSRQGSQRKSCQSASTPQRYFGMCRPLKSPIVAATKVEWRAGRVSAAKFTKPRCPSLKARNRNRYAPNPQA